MSTATTSSDVLYHYCSMESLYGILSSRTLRLTNIRYMNDSKEISWLYELAKKVILNGKRHNRTDAEVKLCDILLGHCDNLFLDETFFPNVFCSCFSKNGDSLGQWRAYADDGRGVAIGFNRTYLNLFVPQNLTRLQEVTYLTDSELSALSHELEEAFSRLKESLRPLIDDEISSIARITSNLWDDNAPFCKNAAFREEDEVRLVHVRSLMKQAIQQSNLGTTKFAHRAGVISPFLEMPLEPSAKPIARIHLGPRNRVEHNRWGIMEFAKSQGIQLARDQFEVSSASYGELRRTAKFFPPHF